ncbi:MAG: TonB-dependent receptor [Cyclobacteriaceae bacterium]|nr:TonB-dependent receptor [Cyclobacteriaceae bacterium]
MKRLYVLLLLSFVSMAWAQGQTTISGTVLDEKGESLAGVNLIIKGKVIGTVTDLDGKFNLRVDDKPPMTLLVSFVGYRTQEVSITSPSTAGLSIKMEEAPILGQEIVVSASRVEEKIMESPVSIEKMDILAVQNTTADNYYKGLANLKGVDVTSSSINFQIINTRGFGSTGNTRFVQLTDGMDTQAPALNFPIGNLNGPSELDVESVELIPGASSALYGPNAFNGILLVNSKNPFEYQGLSAFVKQGVNHVGPKADAPASPLYDAAIRYAKAFNNKFAFKVNAAFMKAEDWHGTDATDRSIARTPSGFNFNPGADKLHYMGDEAAINLAIFPLSSGWRLFADNQGGSGSTAYNNIFDQNTHLTALNYAQAGDLPSQVVSVTPYLEKNLISYNAKNIKASAGLFYRLNDKMELSYLYNGGFGTSIYTGAQRYSLKNFGIQQHRIQLRGDNFYVRAYGTFENSGDSYITEFLAKRINDLAVSSANPVFNDVSGYLATYGTEYLRYLYQSGLQPGEINTLPTDQRTQIQELAHQFARGVVDNKFILDPNSARFQQLKDQAMQGTIPQGPKFSDHTRMYHGEFQYDFKNQVKFMELMTGGSYRMYDLRSNGTIFDDKTSKVSITEFGGYVQAGKWLNDRKIKLSGSGRYDKNLNFKGRFNPRLSVLFKLSENSNIRVSYQTGFRIPSTQGQHIDLSILTARLLGGLPRYSDKYQIIRQSETGQPLSFEGFSVERYASGVFNGGANQAAIFDPNNIAELKSFSWTPVKPERVQNFEVGYKNLINNRLLIDLTYYYNIYNDFITQVQFRIADQFTTDVAKQGVPGYSFTNVAALNGTPNYATLLNGTALDKDANGRITGNTGQIYTNFTETVTGQGAVAGLTYSLPRGYTLSGNYNWNVLIKQPDPSKFLTEFNTPAHKFNIMFGNRKVTDRIGFNLTYRWQDKFAWQSSFTIPRNGDVPAYQTVDAQVTYRVPSMKSVVKIGGSNIMNNMYIQSLGGPNIGAIYYVSVTFDELFK